MNYKDLDLILNFLPVEITAIIYDYYYDANLFCGECNMTMARSNNCVNCQWTLSWY